MILLKTDHPLHPDNIFKLDPSLELPLYMDGMLDTADKGGVAIVGTRKPSLEGIKLTRTVAAAAAKAGVTVVSGLARGIDTEAHRAALAAGGRTIAVLGTGLKNIYPEENIALAHEIAERGAVLSQFEPETPPLKRNFPIRNKTVAILADTLVLIEAPVRSGSLITARCALEAGRTVWVGTGPAHDERFAGNWEFLKRHEGDRHVRILTDPAALFGKKEEDSIPQVQTFSRHEIETLGASEQRVYGALEQSDSCHFDELVEATGISAAELPVLLLTLQFKGFIEELQGNRYTIFRG